MKDKVSGILIRFHLINALVFVLLLLHAFGRKIINFKEQPRLFYVYNDGVIRVLYSSSVLHMFLCWNLAIFIFNMFVNGTYFELRHFNYVLSKIDDKDGETLQEQLLKAIAAHGKITKTIRGLDRLYRIYAFSMIATMIPSILMTIIMLSNRILSSENVLIMGLPPLLIITYGFLGLTISPARLYDEAYKSKTCLCLNSAIWHPYRPEIYQIALALCNHLEQPNMGVTIWGFAVMTKPLILATFSVMAMIFSLMMELFTLREPSQSRVNSTGSY
ncbi:hypothetical protein RB195_020648 [Necator americanus]|uniref:7TM chemoreceptor n=1 Tax=Necator americanus TaxID=51031 RepID=A0ABR1CLH6_NECAM